MGQYAALSAKVLSKYCKKKEVDAGLKSEEDLLNFSQFRHSGAEVAM